MSFLHPTADVSKEAKIGKGTRIWHQAQVREGAVIGEHCIISKNVYVDHHVTIGNCVKIQNNASIYFGVTLEDGVFVGPHACFTNDNLPRAINPDGSLKTGGSQATDWEVAKTLVKEGASIGANATILAGVTIGTYALVGAGAVVTKDVPDYGLVFGCPAQLKGFVCKCAKKVEKKEEKGAVIILHCKDCNTDIEIPKHVYSQVL